MNLSLRNKLIFGFVGLDILVSILLGSFMYTASYDLFFTNYKKHKLSITKFIASAIEGENHAEFKSIDVQNRQDYKNYQRMINSIYRNEKEVRYIYTLNYIKSTDKLIYALDSDVAEKDQVWIETELFAYSFHVTKEGKMAVEYDLVEYTSDFTIDTAREGLTTHQFVYNGTEKIFRINNVDVLKVVSESPLIVETVAGKIDSLNRSEKFDFVVKDHTYNMLLSFSNKGSAGSDPGMEFVEKQEVIQSLKNMIHKNIPEEIDEDIIMNAYGNFLGAYAAIRDRSGNTVGIVVAEINSKEVQDFKNNISLVAFSISVFTFILTTLIAIFVARYFTKPLETLSSAVNNLAAGKLLMIENKTINKKDEFGNLARSFNVMVNNLKIASEVQENLIIEITTLNESLERKVVERTRTIQAQSAELEKQIMIAQKIQLALLPEKVPSINGATLSFRYQPMMKVGGDLIDFYNKNEKELTAFICDVSGHGVPAAFLATMAKMALQDCYDNKLSPSESITRLYKSLKGKLSDHFLSATFCAINLETGIMRFANAGHLPLILVDASGKTTLLESKGRVINEHFPPNPVESEVQLKEHDKVILYTDGVIEARNKEKELFGTDRLRELSTKYYDVSATILCDSIYNTVLDFAGDQDKSQFDDITILVIHYKGR